MKRILIVSNGLELIVLALVVGQVAALGPKIRRFLKLGKP
jgi:hypothetical protein